MLVLNPAPSWAVANPEAALENAEASDVYDKPFADCSTVAPDHGAVAAVSAT
jgi:hypothetical protein